MAFGDLARRRDGAGVGEPQAHRRGSGATKTASVQDVGFVREFAFFLQLSLVLAQAQLFESQLFEPFEQQLFE